MKRKREAVDGALVAMVAEVMLVCAAILLFFVQLSLPISVSTGGALLALFAGSLLCWRSQAAAIVVLAVSLIVSQAILALHFAILLLPFAMADVIIVMVVSGAWHAGEQGHA